ncbi:g10526 [Coccomyxa elongata]
MFSIHGYNLVKDGPVREETDEGAVGKVVRFLLVGSIAAVALKLAPSIGAGNVIGAVGLLEADTALMQRTGADRVRMLANTGWADDVLLREGAPAKLLALLSKGSDPSVMVAGLKALDALCATYDGREAVVLTGAVDRLQEALDGDWVSTEDGREAIAQLLVILRIQQNNIE